jgi:putative ABC transport system permease protein
MLLRKMARNRWLAGSLLTGMLCCIALTSSMPLYKNAVLRYMLIQDLDRSYAYTGHHPGVISIDIGMRTDNRKTQKAIVERYSSYWEAEIAGSERLDVQLDQRIMETVRFALTPVDPTRVDPKPDRSAKFAARTGLEGKVRVVDGRLPEKRQPVDGAYEVMVTDAALSELKMLLGQEFRIEDPRVERGDIVIRPVAVIAEENLSDPYWSRWNLQQERNSLFLPEDVFRAHFPAGGPIIYGKVGALAVTDYTVYDTRTASFVLDLKGNLSARMMGNFNYSVSTSVWIPGSDAMTAYADRELTLRNLLWSLNVPLLILIAFYLYMVSGMLIERQQAEIAVLRSRGASRLHIVAVYAMEFGLLTAAALAAGPWLGAAFTRVLGSTSTFLNFVDRGALHVEMTAESWLYAGLAAVFTWVVNLAPVVFATRVTIVDQKRARARVGKRPAWMTFGLDFILIGLSFYGYWLFTRRMQDLVKLGLDGKSLSADPLLYTTPTLFVLGAGLLLIRVYPLLIALIYRIGRKIWTPPLYSTLLLVSRRNRVYHGLMLFLVLTIGTGVYNANAARTINVNMEDQVWYAGGADIVLRQHWRNDAPVYQPGGPAGPRVVSSRINYLEPPFELIETLPGVQRATPVFRKEEADAWFGTKSGKVTLMGIVTDGFGETAWMKDGLLPYHFHEYLNLIAPEPQAALVSKTAADFFGLGPGDVIDVGWQGRRPTRLTVYGVIEYFPSFNPNPTASAQGRPANVPPMLVVAHLDTIRHSIGLEPYDVWVKLEEGADRQALLDAIAERNIRLEKFEDTIGAIGQSRLDPFRMAVNGVMSLGFIVSLVVSFIGFMLFWLLSLQGRMLQLGICRAMGISFRQLLGMLVVEQLLTTGAGFLIGIGTGLAAGRIFVPLFQLSFDPGKIVPPFEVVPDNADIVRLAVATAFMLAVALLILAWLLKRMNIHQAVKLGED